MTETQERFLRTVLTRVSLEDVVEMHLFPPIRRGTMETGVAVIATILPPPPLTVIDDSPYADEPPMAEIDEALVAQSDEAPVAQADEALVAQSDEALVAQTDEAPLALANEAVITLQDAADEPAPDLEFTDADDAPEAVTPPVPSPRLRILTAAYRHTIKGIDRGKWAVDVQEEADAPLEAVEAVLRGVRQRSTEPADPELVSHDALAALIVPARVAPAA